MNISEIDPEHPRWRKDPYGRGHILVRNARGRADHCIFGHTLDLNDRPAKYEWANLMGDYLNPDDYAPMCRVCHRRFDNAQKPIVGTGIAGRKSRFAEIGLVGLPL